MKGETMQKFWQWWHCKNNQFLVLTFLAALTLVLGMILLITSSVQNNPILTDSSASQLPEIELSPTAEKYLIVDIGGAVVNPGIYVLAEDSYLADLIAVAGGFKSNQIDEWWLQRYLNLAEKLVNNQKYYIPYLEEATSIETNQSDKSTQVNSGTNQVSLNNASLKELTSLPGIGEVRAQAIIDNRPYTEINALLEKDVLTEKIFDNLKELVSL
ncbi:MAG: helix-hairpin-helix domain-containing protein [bacterium]|nr:helix-hairpin-helix domain-containing protein [bacterium]